MRFIRNIAFDIRNGIIRHFMLFLLPALITGIASADCVRRINGYLETFGVKKSTVTYGDIWCYLYGGMEKFVPAPGNAFRFPAIWTILFSICSIVVLTYTTNDMLGTGAHVMVAGGSRGKWWFSKVIWNVLSTLMYHGITLIVSLIVCIFSGIRIGNGINAELQISLNEIADMNSTFKTVSVITPAIFIMPVIISVAMNLLQQMLTLFISPGYAFICTGVLMMASVYIMSPLLPFNYAMALRMSEMYEGGVKHMYGILCAVLIITVSVMVGYIRFLRYDIIKKEDI